MSQKRQSRRHALTIKRVFDLTAALVLLVVLSPLLLLCAILIRLTMGSPVIFRQARPGLRGKLFTIYKFRTMRDDKDAHGELLPDGERTTRLGALLRATSIDELPELVNVLRGEMSIVGPRPLLPAYLQSYTPEQARRHDVRPGVTGLAQISGRQTIPFSKRLVLDVRYVDNWSLWLDAKILLLTLPAVLFKAGVVVGQDVTEADDLGLSEQTQTRLRGCD